MDNNIKVANNQSETVVKESNSVFGKIIDKLDGEQITKITVSAIKYGTICFVAYICGAEGIKNLMSNNDNVNEDEAA